MKSYNTIIKRSSCEIVIQKSRFIGYCFPAETEEEAHKYLEETRKKHYDATHNCYAYSVGIDTVHKRFSDDGEPSGTAGMPILSVIGQQNLSNTLVIVTRYFGGTKLGAGGLVRAYSKACSEALAAAGKCEMTESAKGLLTLDYGQIKTVENFVKNYGRAAILGTEYLENVGMTVITADGWEIGRAHV